MQDFCPTPIHYSEQILYSMTCLQRRITPTHLAGPQHDHPSSITPTPKAPSLPLPPSMPSSSPPDAQTSPAAPELQTPTALPAVPRVDARDALATRHTSRTPSIAKRDTPRQASSHRFVVQWVGCRMGAGPDGMKGRPVELIEKLNKRCSKSLLSRKGYTRVFAGLSWTPNRHLAIHTCAPFTAQDVYDYAKGLVEEVVTESFDQAPMGLAMVLDGAWHHAVVHDAPADPRRDKDRERNILSDLVNA
ncbi:hypothetical protein EV715DRAFT_298471, partial [Schizophyllum commune]